MSELPAPTKKQDPSRGNQRGQALVESALVFVILMLFIIGLVEFGWAYFRYLALQDAAGEGAAYGLMFPNWQQGDDSGAPNYNPDPNNIAYRVRHESNAALLDWSTADVDVDAPFLTPGNRITVTVTFEHELITPLLSDLISDGTITLRATAVQAVLAPAPSP